MKKKFAFFTGPFIVGGLEQVLVNASNVLVKAGHDVTIFWSGYVQKNHLYDQILPTVKQVDCCALFHFPIPPNPKGKVKKKLWELKYWILMRRLRKIADYIPDFDTYDYLIDFRNGFSKVCDIPSKPHQKKIFWSHGAYGYFLEGKMLKQSKIFHYDKIICLTEKFRQQFITAHPKYADKIQAIYNPFDLNALKKKAKEPCLQAEELAPFFVHIARIDVDKDITTMLDAYADFYEKTKSPTKMVFLGDGPLKPDFEKKVRNKGLDDQVFFMGSVANPMAWTSKAKALILSSRKEGLPTVLIEGQIAETLVVSSDCPDGPGEILKEGKAGILYPPKDTETLAEILSDIDSGKIEPAPLIQEATNHLTRFDENTFLKTVENL